jgi:3-isopropylmalate/(R)-2-methylmalate dehydratase small subunit
LSTSANGVLNSSKRPARLFDSFSTTCRERAAFASMDGELSAGSPASHVAAKLPVHNYPLFIGTPSMQPFTVQTGLVATMDRADVDTDQIIPKQFLKRIERTGYGDFLFFDWRYLADGAPDPAFELNRPEFHGASILVARRNFGCGSSREHAVWAIENYGFRVVIAPSFADIFFNNCFKNGVLPIKLSETDVQTIFTRTAANRGYQLRVDLQTRRITDNQGLDLPFDVDPFRRECLLNGWDDIALTLRHADKISEFETRRAAASAS